MFWARIPRYMEDDLIRLRPLKFRDGPFLSKGIRDESFLKANGLSRPLKSSWFFIWWWFKKTYVCPFSIELDSRLIGFIGLYNMRLGKSAEISLMIFDEILRRRGYGTRAFKLFMRGMQKHGVVKNIQVKIKADNQDTLSFCKKLGFRTAAMENDVICMSMDLDKFREDWS